MLTRLLLSAAIVAATAFVFFHLGKWEERRRVRRQLARAQEALNQMMRDDGYSLSVMPALREAQEDTAAMMREMEFYGEAQGLVTCSWRGRA